MRAVVTAPTPRPPAYGLLAAAPTVDDGDMRWAGGWEFLPEGCGLGGRTSMLCAGQTSDDMIPARGPGIADGDPVWVWAGDVCSTFGTMERDWQGRARRQLQLIESYELAAELWDGTVTAADSLANRTLTGVGDDQDDDAPGGGADDIDVVTAGATDLVGALACTEAGLANALRGAQGMVHVTTGLLTRLVAALLVAKQGNVWTTPNGHVLVADAGYSGAGPGGTPADGDSQWLYGTPIIQVRLGPVQTIPESLDGARNLAAAMDRGVNDIAVIAGRVAGFQWVSECAHVAAQVDEGVCTAIGTGS